MNIHYFDQEHLQGYEWIKDEILLFENCSRILDVGCGTGWFCEILKNIYPKSQIFGTDLIDKRKFKDFNFSVANINHLPYPASYFDGISAKAVLEHVTNPLEGVKEINRVLNNGGIFFVSVPDVKDKHFWDDYTHVRPFTKNSIFTLLNDGGFSVERYWYMSSVPLMGKFMKFFRIKDQTILRSFGKIGIFRSSINVVAHKVI